MIKHRTYIFIILILVISFATYGQKTSLKFIEPEIGFTPDISVDAKKNLERVKKMIATVDSIVNSYPNYETAKKHLTARQISIYENEEEYSKEDHLGLQLVLWWWS